MEKVRIYTSKDVRRAFTAQRNARDAMHRHQRSFIPPHTLVSERVAGIDTIVPTMQEAHADWVTTKFSPALSYTQGITNDERKKERAKRRLERSFRTGLKNAVRMHAFDDDSDYDNQDIVVAYTAGFLRVLDICERMHIHPNTALKLAERSFDIDGQTLVKTLKKYAPRFPRQTIIQTVVHKPRGYDESLDKLSDRVVNLSGEPEYASVPIHIVRSAVVYHPTNTQEVLDRYLQTEHVPPKEFSSNSAEVVLFVRERAKAIDGIPFVPLEVRRMGKAMRRARETDSEITIEKIALSLGVEPSQVIAFEEGMPTSLNPDRVYAAISVIEVNMDAGGYISEMLTHKEELSWLRTLARTRGTSRRNSIGRGLRLLRLAEKKDKVAYQTAADVGRTLAIQPDHVAQWESGYRTPEVHTMRNIIAISPLAQLGENTKAAQFMLLITPEQEKQGTKYTSPMRISELKTCPFGDLMRYLRRLRGATQKELAKAVGGTDLTIGAIENGERDIAPESVEALIKWLSLSRTSSLAQILRDKAEKAEGEISDMALQGALEDQYLFQEHIDGLYPYRLTTQDADILPWLDSLPTAGRVDLLRIRIGLGKRALARQAHITLHTLTGLLTGKTKYTMSSVHAKLLDALGYDDIHNPIVQSYYDKMAEERMTQGLQNAA